MLAKIWKKVALAILMIACLFNVVSKLVAKTSLKKELETTAQYVYTEQKEKNKINNEITK